MSDKKYLTANVLTEESHLEEAIRIFQQEGFQVIISKSDSFIIKGPIDIFIEKLGYNPEKNESTIPDWTGKMVSEIIYPIKPKYYH